MGKILCVDLTAGVCSEEALNPEVAKNYIGGRGLGIFYLTQEAETGVDPLSPQNPIIMATGPLSGTGAPTGTGKDLLARLIHNVSARAASNFPHSKAVEHHP